MEKDIEVNGKKIKLKELSYLDAIELAELSKKEQAKFYLKKCTDLSEEDIEKLSIKDGIQIQSEISKLLDLSDFQNPVELKEN